MGKTQQHVDRVVDGPIAFTGDVVIEGTTTAVAITATTVTAALTGNVTGNLTGEINGAHLDSNATGVGFYGTAPIAKQTGVAVSAAGIHAALVALGLIGA